MIADPELVQVEQLADLRRVVREREQELAGRAA